MKYLFERWDALLDKLRDKFLFIFLDFDGTLAPIARTPDKAVLPKKVRAVLEKLAQDPRVKLAFISGRRIDSVKNKVGLKGVIYSGNHGLEIEGPKINFRPAVSPAYRVILERIKSDLEKKISSIEGAFVEDKGLTLSLHYRLVDKSRVAELKTIFHEAAVVYLARGKIRFKPGKMVLEVRPPVEWDKGRVVLWLLARQAFALEKKNILPIYIGDDTTDEDAFKALQNKGLTISVGRQKGSCAEYYLKSQGEVSGFLKRISEVHYA